MKSKRRFGNGLQGGDHTVDMGDLLWYATQADAAAKFSDILSHAIEMKEVLKPYNEDGKIVEGEGLAIVQITLEDAIELKKLVEGLDSALVNLSFGIESRTAVHERMTTINDDIKDIINERRHGLEHPDDRLPLGKMGIKLKGEKYDT